MRSRAWAAVYSSEAAAEALLQQVKEAGTLDAANQPLALMLMALGPEDVSRLRLGALTPFSVDLLRLLRDFFGGKEPNTEINPDEAVAIGVAIQEGILGGAWPMQVAATELPIENLKKIELTNDEI